MGTKVVRKFVFHALDIVAGGELLMVNIGGGHFLRRNWKVLDCVTDHYHYNRMLIDYEHDLTGDLPMPFKTATVDLFYSSHVFEHIPNEYCDSILKDIYRCLRPNGAIRLTMPDFDLAYAAYQSSDVDFFEHNPGTTLEAKFLDFFASFLKERVSPADVRQRFAELTKEHFANHFALSIPHDTQKKNPGYHINWWNYDKLQESLARAGFQRIYRSVEQGSVYVEMRGRGRQNGFDSTFPEISLFVEAVK